VTQGLKIGQLALLFGANDMGSLMIEENVVSAAGTVHHLTLDEIKDAIRELGFEPRRRNVFYELLDDVPELDSARRNAPQAKSADLLTVLN
jgi:cyclic dehypoxanthinyl futalosine synthase